MNPLGNWEGCSAALAGLRLGLLAWCLVSPILLFLPMQPKKLKFGTLAVWFLVALFCWWKIGIPDVYPWGHGNAAFWFILIASWAWVFCLIVAAIRKQSSWLVCALALGVIAIVGWASLPDRLNSRYCAALLRASNAIGIYRAQSGGAYPTSLRDLAGVQPEGICYVLEGFPLRIESLRFDVIMLYEAEPQPEYKVHTSRFVGGYWNTYSAGRNVVFAGGNADFLSEDQFQAKLANQKDESNLGYDSSLMQDSAPELMALVAGLEKSGTVEEVLSAIEVLATQGVSLPQRIGAFVKPDEGVLALLRSCGLPESSISQYKFWMLEHPMEDTPSPIAFANPDPNVVIILSSRFRFRARVVSRGPVVICGGWGAELVCSSWVCLLSRMDDVAAPTIYVPKGSWRFMKEARKSGRIEFISVPSASAMATMEQWAFSSTNGKRVLEKIPAFKIVSVHTTSIGSRDPFWLRYSEGEKIILQGPGRRLTMWAFSQRHKNKEGDATPLGAGIVFLGSTGGFDWYFEGTLDPGEQDALGVLFR